GLTVSIRQYDDIIQLWNKNASSTHAGLMAKVKALLPNTEIKNAFYKGTPLVFLCSFARARLLGCFCLLADNRGVANCSKQGTCGICGKEGGRRWVGIGERQGCGHPQSNTVSARQWSRR